MVSIQKIETPFDRAPKSALTLGEIAGATGKEAETGSESIPDAFQRQVADPGSRQLDGQGQAVEPGDNVGHHGSISRLEGEVGSGRPRSIHEQRHRFESHEGLWGQ